MSTKRNDSKGYERGARGIDGKDGEGWQEQNVDKSACAGMYGRSWWGQDGKGDFTAPNMANNDKGRGSGGKGTDALLKSARQGNAPILGGGSSRAKMG